MTAYDYLNSIRILDSLIQSKLEEQQQLKDLATQITQAGDGMPHAIGVSDKVGNTVSKLVDLQNDTAVLVEEYKNKRQEVIKVIELLPPNQYAVLHKRFVLFKKWEEIADEMMYSERQVHRIRKRAIRLVQYILDEKKMS